MYAMAFPKAKMAATVVLGLEEAKRYTFRHIVILRTGGATLSSGLSVQQCPPMHEHGDVCPSMLRILGTIYLFYKVKITAAIT